MGERRHPPWFCHIKSSTQNIFLTLFCRSTAHELFLTLFQVFLDFILQHTHLTKEEEGKYRQGGWGRQGSSRRETLEEHRPWAACWEISGWSPVCSKRCYRHNFMSRSMDEQGRLVAMRRLSHAVIGDPKPRIGLCSIICFASQVPRLPWICIWLLHQTHHFTSAPIQPLLGGPNHCYWGPRPCCTHTNSSPDSESGWDGTYITGGEGSKGRGKYQLDSKWSGNLPFSEHLGGETTQCQSSWW